jgi:hypothetical protein
MTVFGVDHAAGRPGVAALKKAGVRFVARYLSHNAEKNLTPAEARQLSKAGISIVVVWETTAQRALSGKLGGIEDARAARAQAQACGMPDDRPIYFAVDWDAQPRQLPAVMAYLDGAASVLGAARTGVYGGYRVVRAALSGRHCAWAWQTYAWSGGQWDKRAQLQQYSNDHVINGVGVDYNRATRDDYGQWRVGISPTEDDVTPQDMQKLADMTASAVVKKAMNARGRTMGQAAQTADDGIPKILTGMARLLQAAGHPVDIDEAELAEMLAPLLTPTLAERLLSTLTPEAIGEAIPEGMAEQVVDIVSARLARPASPSA